MGSPRQVGGVALVLTLVAFPLAPAPAGPQGAPRSPGVDQVDQGEDLAHFLELLDRLRRGDEGAAAGLLAVAQRLCAEHGRCDTLDVARTYAALTPEERARGLEDEVAFLALRDQVVRAGAEGLGAEGLGGRSWPLERRRICAELERLAAAVEARADVAPAARAYSLVARLELQEVAEADPSDPGPEGRAAWIARVQTHLGRSVALFGRAGQVTPRLEPLWVRGRLARARGEREAARADFEACCDLALRVGQDPWRERGLLGLVELAKDVGDVARVDRLLGSVARFRDPRESWPLAREHAGRLLHDDRPDAALAFLLAHPPRAEAHRDAWRGMLGVAFLRSGDLAAARAEIAGLEDGGGEFARLARASLALAQGQPAEALEILGVADGQIPGRSPRSGGGRSKGSWSEGGRPQAAALEGEAWLAQGRPDRALPPLREALDEGLERQRLSEEAGGSPGGSVVGEWVGLHAVTLLARAHAELGEGLAAAVAIEEHQSRRLRPPGARVDGSELLAWAAGFDLGLVTWGVGADGSVVAWITAQGDARAEAIPLGRRAVGSAVRRLREAILAEDPLRARALGAELAGVLFPPDLSAHLGSGAPGDRVLLLVHGPVEGLPLSFLELDGVGLDERLCPVALPGLPGQGLPGERGDGPPSLGPGAVWSLLGAPVDGAGEVLLPGAAEELAELARRHPGAFLASGAEFERGAVERALARGGPLHLATHLHPDGACDDGRLAPAGLQLSGGVLCAAEILDLAPRLPLVVLSACETAGGRVIDAEGAHGVGRAFLEAGTRNLLVTLWPVRDGAARAFALAFHNALEGGAAPSAAARAARQELREGGLPPADWAAFRLMGRD